MCSPCAEIAGSARAAELYASLTSEERAKFDAAVTERLGKALAAKQPKDLRRFIAYFGFHPMADEAREQLFAQLTQPETALERELLLEDLDALDRRRAAPGGRRPDGHVSQ